MNNAHFSKVFALVLASIFLLSFSITAQTADSNVLTQTLTNQQKDSLKQHFLDDANQIANVLIKSATPTNVSGSGLKWNKYYNLTDSTAWRYYYGYYYGAAGIGDYFTSLYNQTLNTTYLNIAIQAYNYINAYAIEKGSIYDGYFNQSGFVIWNKTENDPNVYLGVKYGNAGISNFLLHLYENTRNNTFLDLALKSLNTLIYVANKGSDIVPGNTGLYWDYSLPGSDTIVDIIYGDAGITSSFLNAYSVTKNQTYLNIAGKAVEFMLSQSAITNNSTNGQRYVRFSPSPFYPYAFTGYLTGTSGVGSVLLDFYQITKNTDYLLFARQIGNWLAANESNGLWALGGADLLTNDINEAGSFTGFGAGSAGIGIFLLDLYNATHDITYLKSVKEITNMFTKEAIISGNSISFYTKIGDSKQQIVQTDLKMGLAGIGLFFSSLYHYFGLSEGVNFLYGLKNFLDSKVGSNGIIPKTIGLGNQDNTNYDLSLLEGITGIGFFFLKAYQSMNATPVYSGSIFIDITLNTSTSPGFEIIAISIVLFLALKRKSIHKK